nr:hypothetical protein JVH1_0997 [Rhodococcus sp. JVH1]
MFTRWPGGAAGSGTAERFARITAVGGAAIDAAESHPRSA